MDLFVKMAKRKLVLDWKSVDGAAKKKRVLHLRTNDDGIYICPITICLHVGFKSERGARKHINAIHPWYFFFDNQPNFDRGMAVERTKERLKASTHKKPAFSLEVGLGYEFYEWLQTTLGGGKSPKEAIQVGRRAMKFLMSALNDENNGAEVKEDYIECCVGSPSIINKFLRTLTEEWKVGSSCALNYLKAITDLMDFRKCNGITDNVLRSFAVSEVYLRRGKDNLAKEKRQDYKRNLQLEKLMARNSWSTLEDMELVIPFHTPKFELVVEKCKTAGNASVGELSFATRYIATFLFLRVKCTRPMTLQYLTTDMVELAENNGGYIDQTMFKTEERYMFDTLVISDDVLQILRTYMEVLRPLMNPSCDYLIVTTAGKQYTAFGTAMSLLTHQAIGKAVNQTRYRQIVESESSISLQPAEREIISHDQKHSSQVAKIMYQKRLSREVAKSGKKCMLKLTGHEKEAHTALLANKLRKQSGNGECSNNVGSNHKRGNEQETPQGTMQKADVKAITEGNTDKACATGNADGLAKEKIDCSANILSESSVEREKEAGSEKESVSADSNKSNEDENAEVFEISSQACMKSNRISHEKGDEIEVLDTNGVLPEQSAMKRDNSKVRCMSSDTLVCVEAMNCSPSGTTAAPEVDELDVQTAGIKKIHTSKEFTGATRMNEKSNNEDSGTIESEVKEEEEEEKEVSNPVTGMKLRRFTAKEDNFLREGIQKFGIGKWSIILKAKEFHFHACRTRDSLRVRAETLGLSKRARNGRKRHGE